MQCQQLEVTQASPSPQLRLQWRDMPQPGPGEVLVQMQASSVNPIDAKRSQGYGQRLLRIKGASGFPIVMGNDIAGVVQALGSRVSGFKVGDKVFGFKGTGRSGTHASHVVADARFLRPAPKGMTPAELAVLPYSFTTMLQALQGAGLSAAIAPDKAVLVVGASGGLGQLALQVLAQWRARVTAIAETPTVELCRQLGAVEVIDRLVVPMADLPARFDAVLNFAVMDEDDFLASRLRPGALGYATTVNPVLGNFDRFGWLKGAVKTAGAKRRGAAVAKAAGPGARYAWTIFKPDGAALDMLCSGLQQGRFRLPLGISVPLAEGARAFEHVLQGRPGRASLLCGTASR